MSNQRNADKDRELFTLALSNRVEFLTPYGDIVLHWLERAAAAEQRVAELTEVLEELRRQLSWGSYQASVEYAIIQIDKALKGGTDND